MLRVERPALAGPDRANESKPGPTPAAGDDQWRIAGADYETPATAATCSRAGRASSTGRTSATYRNLQRRARGQSEIPADFGTSTAITATGATLRAKGTDPS